MHARKLISKQLPCRWLLLCVGADILGCTHTQLVACNGSTTTASFPHQENLQASFVSAGMEVA